MTKGGARKARECRCTAHREKAIGRLSRKKQWRTEIYFDELLHRLPGVTPQKVLETVPSCQNYDASCSTTPKCNR